MSYRGCSQVFKEIKSDYHAFITLLQVVYFTAPFPYVLLTILLVRALTLENSMDGLAFYLTPNMTRLGDGQVSFILKSRRKKLFHPRNKA